MSKVSFYWHDYETFGTDPQRDRACQFAGIRTDEDFNIIGDPLTIYCKPAADCLPHAEACLVTGITPQIAEANGVCEAEFIRLIHQQIAHPSTCTAGYNNIRFDDEVTRNLLYRNLYDPYAREWQNHNSRWDLIDVVRACCALRPQGIEWPEHEDGSPSFKLEALTQANEIQHASAHDALSDVYATIEMATLVKTRQPRLYQFLFEHRQKNKVEDLLMLGKMQPVVHVSGMFSAKKHCLAVVVALCRHPENNNGIIVYNLHIDPEPLLGLTAEQVRERLFTATEDLADGVERIPLKTVHINKCPVIAPLSVIKPEDAERLHIDLAQCHKNVLKLQQSPDLGEKIQQVFSRTSEAEQQDDPDLMIYTGGFFPQSDKNMMNQIREAQVEELQNIAPGFTDERLPEMFFRYKARNYPATLTDDEKHQWKAYCAQVMSQKDIGSQCTLQGIAQTLRKYSAEANKADILEALWDFVSSKAKEYKIDVDGRN